MIEPQIDIGTASFKRFMQHLDWLLRHKSTEAVADALRARARLRGLKHSAQLQMDAWMAADLEAGKHR